MLADVVLPQRRYCLFTYVVPQRFTDRIHVGSRVLVPLGRQLVPGFVFALTDRRAEVAPEKPVRLPALREIHELIDEPLDTALDAHQIALAKRVTDYYLAPPAAALRLVLPPMPFRRPVTRYVLTEEGKRAIQEQARLSDREKRLLVRLLRHPKGLTAPTLFKAFPGISRMLPRLAQKQWIQAVETVPSPIRSTPPRHPPSPDPAQLEPKDSLRSDVQELPRSLRATFPFCTGNGPDEETNAGPTWWRAFLDACTHRHFRVFLFQAIREQRSRQLMRTITACVAHRRPSLILTPEIDQAEALASHLQDRFGPAVMIYHSDLSIARRLACWQAVREGAVSIVVGTHMAVFLPFFDLGAIWIEQEDHPSFKAEQMPYYHARTVAEMCAEIHQAALILSTAHPSLETYHRFSRQADHAETATPCSWPRPQIVPLNELSFDEVFSEAMVDGMAQTLEAGGQVILFVNRKGFSRALQCRDCGHVLRCERCGVPLVLYQDRRRLACPYCPRSKPVPETCSICLSSRWRSSGVGTERVESRVRTLFPSVPTARFDRENLPTRARETAVGQAFARGDVRILVGTELLIRTQTMLRASFVGLPFADAGLHFPDFRAAERTYHVLSDVMGLALDDSPSRIVLQTALPTHHVIEALAQQDPAIFYRHELELRRTLGYPPFSQLVQLTISGRSKDAVEAAALAYAARLRTHLQQTGWVSESVSFPPADPVLGPIPARQRSTKHRWVLLLKNHDFKLPVGHILQEVGRGCEQLFKANHVTCEINVDPMEMR